MKLVHGGGLGGLPAEFGGMRWISRQMSAAGAAAWGGCGYLGSAATADRYPDPLCRELRVALAAAEGVPIEHILCGSGAADLIFRLVLAVQPRRALLPAPTFAEYAAALDMVGCTVDRFLLDEANDFAVTEDFVQAVTEETDMVFLCQPNNPTGQVTPPALVERLISRCADCGAVLVVDECFLDFLPDRDALTAERFLNDAPNLVILKPSPSSTLWRGCGWAMRCAVIRHCLPVCRRRGSRGRSPGLAQAAGLAALQESAYAEEVRALIEPSGPGWLPGCGHWDCMLSRAGPTICCSAPRQTLAKSCGSTARWCAAAATTRVWMMAGIEPLCARRKKTPSCLPS